jgi:hypothetical protein
MKNKTIICHFYNEEYLLPWWLNHHKNIFSDGIMIDYGSTDKSVEIINSLCPTWKVINTRNKYFGAVEIDQEIHEIERSLSGKRIVLNVTEFLVGNISKLDSIDNELFIPMASMVEKVDGYYYPDEKSSLTSQCLNGVNPHKYFESGSRLLHSNNYNIYPTGRHYWSIKNTDDFLILRYKHSPWNEKFIKRKMQIGAKQLMSDLDKGWGTHHQFNINQLEAERLQYVKKSENLYDLVSKFEYWRYV